MDKETLYGIMNGNPAMHLATLENGEPRVRAILLYSAGDDGIIFHTGTQKELYRQIEKDPSAEICFNDFKKGIQVRVRGKLEEITDHAFKDKIAETPGREFLKKWRDSGELADFYGSIHVYSLKRGLAHAWTMETNFAPKEIIAL